MPPSSSPISYAQINLGYPIFDAEFDPYNRGYLVVGGGGGEGRSGVSNKITLLDVTSRSQITNVAELDLGQDEDSVQSLASLATADGLMTYAGVNSSVAERDGGKNEHFRSFEIKYPAKKKRRKSEDEKGTNDTREEVGSITRAGKTALLQAASAKTRHITQKFLSLSPARLKESGGNRRLGAIASGLDKGDTPEGEIVLFSATTSIPDKNSICARIRPKDGIHVEDLALDEPKEGSFAIAYCSEESVFLNKLDHDFKDGGVKSAATETISLYSVPPSDAFTEPGRRPKIRALRWLSPSHLLILQNYPPRSGAELLVLWLDEKTGKPGDIVAKKALPRSCKLAVGLDVCRLDADPASGERQIAIAVSSQDYSIHILLVDHRPKAQSKTQQISSFSVFSHLSDVHSYPITKIAFANFFPPRQPANSPTSVASSAQYLRLASVSLANTVVVDTFALTSTPASPSDTPDAPDRRKTPAVRWVLASRFMERMRSWTGLILVGFVVLVSAVLLQGLLNRGDVSRGPSVLSVLNRFDPPGAVPPNLRSVQPQQAAQSSISSLASSLGATTGERDAAPSDLPLPTQESARKHHHLRDVRNLLHLRKRDSTPSSTAQPSDAPAEPQGGQPALVVHPHPEDGDALAASRHDDAETLRARGARPFEELEEKEKERWRTWLSDAGHWSKEEGETVLKGVFFSQWAEVVGGAIAEAVLH